MNPTTDQRDEMRQKHESPILIEEFQSGKYYEGRMVNYSTCGMSLQSDFRLEPGTDIFIGIENSPYSANHDIYRAQVIWCKELPDDTTFFRFGIGVKYY